MSLHLLTLLVALFAFGLAYAAAVLFVAWGARGRDGLREWGLGLLINALTYPCFGLRLFDGWLPASILLSNGLLAAALSVQLLGLMRFRGYVHRPGTAWLVWGPALATLVLCWVLIEAHGWRLVTLNLLLLFQAGLLAWQAWGRERPGPEERGRLLVVVGCLCLMLLAGWRVGIGLVVTDWDVHLGVSPQVTILSYLLASIVLALNTLGFVLMQQERAVREQHEQAIHDPLTGIANRRALDQALALEAARAARTQHPLALLMIDIDWFKKVNDTHGHHVGDGVLRALAGRLQGRLRRQDLLARFGGEEFVVLLPDTGADGALVLADGLRDAVAAAPFLVEGLAIAITISIGVAAGVPSRAEARGERGNGSGGGLPDTVSALLVASDQALYRAKQEGRNRVCGAA